MPANISGRVETPFPVRGVAGGWHDRWESPDDHAELRVQGEAIERRIEATAAQLGARLRREIARESSAAGNGCPST